MGKGSHCGIPQNPTELEFPTDLFWGGQTWIGDLVLGAGFKYLYFHPPILGEWSNSTNIFQMGWFNHQLVFFFEAKKTEVVVPYSSENRTAATWKRRWVTSKEIFGLQGVHFQVPGITLPETKKSHLKIGRAPKGSRIVFQPSIFRCDVLVLGRVIPGTFSKQSCNVAPRSRCHHLKNVVVPLGWW